MKIQITKREMKIVITVNKNKAYSIGLNGYPLRKLWNDYYALTYIGKWLCFYVIRYEK